MIRDTSGQNRTPEVEELLVERAGYIEEVKKWRARGNDEEERRWFRECERVNARLTELEYFDVAVDVVVELPSLAVEG
jgi:hypothetical protein